MRVTTWGPATKMMLDLAGLRAGSRVLDVGAGAGDQTVRRGGSHTIEVRIVPTLRTRASAAEVVAAQRSTFPRLVEQIDGLPEAEREPTWQEIEQALAQFEGSHGVEIPGEFLIGVGTA